MVRRVVVTTRRADNDVDGAVTYYLQQGATDVAGGFIDALEDTKDLMAEHPSIGTSRFVLDADIPELCGLALRRFPYVVFYTEDGDALRIIRVLHTSRDIPAELSQR